MKAACALTVTLMLWGGAMPAGAQDISLGGGLTFGSEIDRMGIDLRGNFSVAEQLTVVPNLQLFFDRNSGNVKISWNTLNVDAHYLIRIDDNFYLYPFTGLNLTFYTVKISGNSDTSTRLGLNLGGGGQYRFTEKISGFIEMKYVLSDADQTVASFGVLARIR